MEQEGECAANFSFRSLANTVRFQEIKCCFMGGDVRVAQDSSTGINDRVEEVTDREEESIELELYTRYGDVACALVKGSQFMVGREVKRRLAPADK